MKKGIYIGIDKRKIKAVMPSSLFFAGVYFPIPKEKVIEFDQSIEAYLRERETCAVNGLRV